MITHLPLTLGFSPCPNDTFMFDAMVHHRIDTEGLEFDVVMEDVETLNLKALSGKLDVTKVSFATFVRIAGNYILLNSGSALGEGVGPLLISKRELQNQNFTDGRLSIAIPGKNTTANFLFSIFFPEATNKKEMIFSDIEAAVLNGETDAGVIIHENRFTYTQKGLKKVCDLGELWQQSTHQPIPLGGIAAKRTLSADVLEKLDRVMQRSVEYAFSNRKASETYVKQHAQEMDDAVRKQHIDLYVNNYSVDLGNKGRKAIEYLFEKAKAAGIIDHYRKDIFVQKPEEAIK